MRRRDNSSVAAMMFSPGDMRANYVEYPKQELDLYLGRT
jgi:hypothetical protein